MDNRDLVVRIKGDASDFERSMKQVSSSTETAGAKTANFGNILSTTTKYLKIASTAAVGFGLLSVKAFSESEDLIAQTNAVLKSTGQVAGVTADAVDKLSKSLQRQTKYSDEDVRSVENLLLTFTSIGKDIFPQATKTVLDMATALGEDTKSASIQLGKALQDPILGVTALRRVGVNFNAQQLDTIKNLVATNQQFKAQQLILAELNKEFGGSAVAAGNTFSGGLAKLKNQINDLEEQIGGLIVNALNPYIQQIANYVSTHGPELQAMMKTLVDTVARLTVFFKDHGKTILEVVAAYKLLKITAEITTLIRGLGTVLAGATTAMRLFAVAGEAGSVSLLGGVAALGPYALAIVGVAAAGYGLYRLFHSLHDKYQENLDDVKSVTDWTGRYTGAVTLLQLAEDRKTIAEQTVKNTTDQLKSAQDAAKASTDQLKASTDNLNNSQASVNDVLAKYGQNSPQYRDATANLAGAQFSYNQQLQGEIDKNLTVQILEGQLKAAKKELADATSALAGWQDYLNGKIGNTIKLVGDMQSAIDLQAIPAVNRLQGSIKQVQTNVGGVVQFGGGNVQSGGNGLQLQGTRAAGGNVDAGKPYLVGEQGQEVFVPGRSGTILPHNQASKGKSTPNVNVTVNVGMYAGMPVEKRQIALELYRELVRAARAQGVQMQMIGAVGVQ
jgi:hypothetical protein